MALAKPGQWPAETPNFALRKASLLSPARNKKEQEMERHTFQMKEVSATVHHRTTFSDMSKT
jgi:hypothetical protein